MESIPFLEKAVNLDGLILPLSGLKILKAVVSANSYSPFYDASLEAVRGVYQVPTGKVFELYGYDIDQISASEAATGVALIYADSATNNNSASAPTTPIGLISGAGSAPVNPDFITSGQIIAGTKTKKSGACGGSAPASKYIHLVCNSFAVAVIYGYERDA